MKEGLRVSQHFPELKRVLSRHGDGRILMPMQSALTVVLPDDHGGAPGGGAATTQSHSGSGSMTQHVRNEVRSHKAFPHREVLIELAEEKLTILNSLMKPSRLTLRGTDGAILDPRFGHSLAHVLVLTFRKMCGQVGSTTSCASGRTRAICGKTHD